MSWRYRAGPLLANTAKTRPMRSFGAWSLAASLPVCAVVWVGACREEALLHPPPPPSTSLPELAPAPPPVADRTAPGAAVAPAVEVTKPLAKKMRMAVLMKDHIEPRAAKASKLKKSDVELERLLEQVKALAPDDPKFRPAVAARTWEGIVDSAVKRGKYGLACRQCHTLYKRPYKRKFHEREIEVVLP